MADLYFYLSEKERVQLLELLYREGCQIIPDIDYIYPNYLILKNIEECNNFFDNRKANLLFIISTKFSAYPFVLEQIKKSDKIIYYIRQRYGGPSLSLFITGLLNIDNMLFLGHGFLSYYPYYYNPANNEKVVVPMELKDLYSKINKWVVKHTVPYKLHLRTYRLGKDAINQVLDNNYNLRDINVMTISKLKEIYKF